MQDGFNELNVETMKGEALQKNTDVQVLYVPLSKIVPNPYQPRKEFESEALSELADSIRQYGVLQPLLVAPGPSRGTAAAGVNHGRNGFCTCHCQ